MLKVALPNKGSLSESAISMFREAGYRQRNDPRDLNLIDAINEIEFYYLRPRDIALYVASGELELGITGRDLLMESNAGALEILPLDFGKSTFRFASIAGEKMTENLLSGKRIATAYPGLVRQYLKKKDIHADVVQLDGAVETSIKLGVADAIADVVSTGGTLRAAGLEVFGSVILDSEAILIERPGSERTLQAETMIRRIQGVVTAKQYVLVDYDVADEFLEKACSLTPGIESPTVSALQKPGWSAVRAMVKRSDINRIMDDLWLAGARGILVTDIHACRL